MQDKVILSAFEIFSHVFQDRLGEIAQECDVLEFKSYDIIFNIDEPAKNFYGVLDGEVELSLVLKDRIVKLDIEYEESILKQVEILERPIVIDMIGPGEVFGWSSLISPGRWTSTARCSMPTRVFSFSAVNLKAIFDKSPEKGYFFMEKLCEIISNRLTNRTDSLIESWGQAFDVDKI